MDSYCERINNGKQKKLGALDVFIIVILIMCIVSIGLRVFSNKTSDISESTQLENYTVSFKVMGIRDSSARNYITKGTKFYLNDSNVYIGAINNGDITITDAQKYYDALDGSTVSATNTGTGDLYKVDVEAAFDVEGKTDSSGRFLLGGNQYIGENQELQIHSKYLSITILVTEITKSR